MVAGEGNGREVFLLVACPSGVGRKKMIGWMRETSVEAREARCRTRLTKDLFSSLQAVLVSSQFLTYSLQLNFIRPLTPFHPSSPQL